MARERKHSVHGGGSIYQRKSDGRWVASFLVEETGQRKYLYADKDDNEQACFGQIEIEQSMPSTELAEGKGQAILESMPDLWSILKALVIGPHLFHLPGGIECFSKPWNNAQIAPGSQDECTFPSLMYIPFVIHGHLACQCETDVISTGFYSGVPKA